MPHYCRDLKQQIIFWGYLSGRSLENYSVVKFKYSSADLSDKEKSIVLDLAVCFSTFS